MAAELGLPRPIGAHITSITPNSPAVAAKLAGRRRDPGVQSHARRRRRPSGQSRQPDAGRQDRALLIFRDRKAFTVMVEVGDRSKFEP